MTFCFLLEAAGVRFGLPWSLPGSAHSALLVCLIPLAALLFGEGRRPYLSKQAVILSYSAFLQH